MLYLYSISHAHSAAHWVGEGTRRHCNGVQKKKIKCKKLHPLLVSVALSTRRILSDKKGVHQVTLRHMDDDPITHLWAQLTAPSLVGTLDAALAGEQIPRCCCQVVERLNNSILIRRRGMMVHVMRALRSVGIAVSRYLAEWHIVICHTWNFFECGFSFSIFD